jgi:hypothetical protein
MVPAPSSLIFASDESAREFPSEELETIGVDVGRSNGAFRIAERFGLRFRFTSTFLLSMPD